MKVTSVLYVYLFLCMINFIKTDDDDSDDYSEDAEDNYDDADDDKHDSAMDIIEDMEDGIGGLTVANYGDLAEEISKKVEEKVGNIDGNIKYDLKHLDNLGSRINEQVEKNLEPVKAMDIRSKMARGLGGITIAEYGGKFSLIIKHGIKYECPGNIHATNTAICTKPLSTTLTENMKTCAPNSISRVNGIYCIGNNALVHCANNSCACQNGKQYTLSDLKHICGNSFGTHRYVKFIYFPNKSDSNHVPIPHSNKHVTCEEGPNAGFKCTWYGTCC